MRIQLARGLGMALMAMAVSSSAPCQAVAIASGRPMSILSSGGLTSASEASSWEVFREIEDSPLRTRWLLLRKGCHPGGPGRLVQSPGEWKESGALAKSALGTTGRLPRTAIRAGDLVVVERRTAVVEERLEAIALEPVPIGAKFHARLTIGGKVVRAVALAEGRAAFEQDAEGQR